MTELARSRRRSNHGIAGNRDRTGLTAAGAVRFAVRCTALAAALLSFGGAGAWAKDSAATMRGKLTIPDAQLELTAWTAMEGWSQDDHAEAFATFLASCRPILNGTPAMRRARPVYGALYDVCRKAVDEKPATAEAARAFFEANFRPVRISKSEEPEGFVTGYYEPIVEGSRVASAEFSAPLRRKPDELRPGGRMVVTRTVTTKPKKGKKAKTRTVRRLVPFHDRAAIEEGALDGKDLEICYLRDPVDAFFAQIQGSVRVRLDDGTMLRLNYHAQNGHPYTAVGRHLIEREHIAKEDMSMQSIRTWMADNPDEAKEIRRLNKSYVFFRETELTGDDEAVGAQGISLTPWRSLAVDRKLHVYGTPFFLSGRLPIDGEEPTTPFHRLMVAQDTGGAIIGPARGDIYFGAGDRAGEIAGRLRHPITFVMLVPNGLDLPGEKRVPLPRPRPMAVAAEGQDRPVSDKLLPNEPTEKPEKKAGASDKRT